MRQSSQNASSVASVCFTNHSHHDVPSALRHDGIYENLMTLFYLLMYTNRTDTAVFFQIEDHKDPVLR